MKKGNSIFSQIIFLLNIIALVFIWKSGQNNYLYTPDLLIYKNAIINFNGDYLQCIIDNNIIVILISKIFIIDSYYLINILQSISILFLTFILLKYFKPYYVLSIVLITFFNLYLNQFRSAFAISFFLISFYNKKNIKLNLMFLFLALIFHFFISVFFIIFFYFEDIKTFYYKEEKYLLSFFLLLILVTIIGYFNSNLFLRYIYYFTPKQNNGVFSLKFLILLFILIMNKRFFKKNNLIILYCVSFLLFITSIFFLDSFSTRISEWMIILILFFLSSRITKNTVVLKMKNIKTFFENNNVLILSTIYFLYSILNVIFADRDFINKFIMKF